MRCDTAEKRRAQFGNGDFGRSPCAVPALRGRLGRYGQIHGLARPRSTGGPGKGSATLSLDTAAKTLTMTIDYSGLSAPPAMAAFLSPPATQNGNPGTLPISLPASPASPISIKMQLSDAAIAGIKNGDWVLLLGTKDRPPKSAARSSRRRIA